MRDRRARVLQVDKMPLDLYAIFKAVAQRGGYQAVSVQRLVIDVKSRASSSEAAPGWSLSPLHSPLCCSKDLLPTSSWLQKDEALALPVENLVTHA